MSRGDDNLLWLLALLWLVSQRKAPSSAVAIQVTKTSPLAQGEAPSAEGGDAPASSPE